MSSYSGKVEEAAAYIRPQLDCVPEIGMICGTGLGDIVETIGQAIEIPYAAIPHCPVSTVQSHRGQLVCGRLGETGVVAMQGRFHLYEGWSPAQIAFPIRVLRSLGVKTLILSNAAGGLNPNFHAGELMVVTDHINLTGHNPLVGPNVDDWGPRFPDMTEPYSRDLVQTALQTAMDERIRLHRGVYAGVLGPSLETAAETRFLKMIGADAVGMSMVMEVITAVHTGMKVLGVSVITNVNLPDCYQPALLEDIIATATAAGKELGVLFAKIIGRLEKPGRDRIVRPE
ncbi:MAG: purine-nucleoside phosphorylase [Desulfobacteraceae bacterium]|nr:purine-nucleoside phosphorylase [Desulfobacteraceae bacterium]